MKIQFNHLNKTLESKGIHLVLSPDGLNYLCQQGYEPEFGARPVKRVVQKELLNELSKQLLSGKLNKGDQIVIESFEDKLVLINKNEELTKSFKDN